MPTGTVVLDAQSMAARAIVLTDGKPGHEGQSVAMARALGLDYRLQGVGYPWRGLKALSYFLDRVGCYSPFLFHTDTPWPTSLDLVIGAGSTTYYAVKTAARATGARSVAVLSPRGYRATFSLEVAPAYDRPTAARVRVRPPVNLCWASPQQVREAMDAFSRRRPTDRPAVGLVLGGDSAACVLKPEAVQAWLERIFTLFPHHERWVTTSRRTSPAVEAVVRRFPFEFALYYSEDTYNPTPAFWRRCERVFVTGDSASMISEAASSGSAYLEVLEPEYRKSQNKFVALVDSLVARGMAHRFDGSLGEARDKVDMSSYFQQMREALGLDLDGKAVDR